MESTRPIRALIRGLDALTLLNCRNGATVSEVAQEIRLPRTTVYRILETLCNGGFVFRDPADDRYRLTMLVQGLSGGFDDDTWLRQIAKPQIDELCRAILWPVSIATLSGSSMMLRVSTDHDSPLLALRQSAGLRLPLLDSAAGKVYLAFCPAARREALLEGAMTEGSELSHSLADIKSQGYAAVTHARRSEEEVSIAVPVLLPALEPAVLTVRFSASAVPLKSGLERFLPRLRQCSGRISTRYSERQESAGVAATP